MQIDDLNISSSAKKMLKDFKIETVDQLLKIDEKSLKAEMQKNPRYRYLFDEIFEKIKEKGYHFAYEYSTYFPYLNSKSEDLEQIKTFYLDLTPDLRKALDKYENIGLFFSTIAYDKKKLKGFLYEAIKTDKDYTWLFELLHHLGNNGTILLLNIYKYQSILKSRTLNFNSLLSDIILDTRVVQALNKKEIYFIGDLVKYNEQGLKDLEGIGAITVDIVKEELAKYNLHLEMEPKSYYELEFSLDSFDISLLNLEDSLERKIRSININTLDNLFFSNKAEFFTTEELLQIRNGFKKLGFDVSKSFFGATVSGDVLEYNNLILQKKLYEEKLKEINEKLAGQFPMLYPNALDNSENNFAKK